MKIVQEGEHDLVYELLKRSIFLIHQMQDSKSTYYLWFM